MPTCTRNDPSCGFEVKLSVAQMNKAIEKAELYRADKSPYGSPVYPWVWDWIPSEKTVRLEMGHDLSGKRFVAVFEFEQQPWIGPAPVVVVGGKQFMASLGVVVHVSIWCVENPTVPDWSATPIVADLRPHNDALNHFKGTLLGLQGSVYKAHVEGDAVPPPPAE